LIFDSLIVVFVMNSNLITRAPEDMLFLLEDLRIYDKWANVECDWNRARSWFFVTLLERISLPSKAAKAAIKCHMHEGSGRQIGRGRWERIGSDGIAEYEKHLYNPNQIHPTIPVSLGVILWTTNKCARAAGRAAFDLPDLYPKIEREERDRQRKDLARIIHDERFRYDGNLARHMQGFAFL
jgi:hypothetical protein